MNVHRDVRFVYRPLASLLTPSKQLYLLDFLLVLHLILLGTAQVGFGLFLG